MAVDLEKYFAARGSHLAHFKTAAHNVQNLLELAAELSRDVPDPAKNVVGIAQLLLDYEKLLIEDAARKKSNE